MSTHSVDHETAQAELGVLVLGALDPAEREAVEAHVAGCPDCAASVADLAPLPGLLKRVDTTSLDLGTPPPEILERALAQVRHEDSTLDNVTPLPRRRTWLAAIGGLVAAAAIVVGVVAVVNTGNTPTRPTASSVVVRGNDAGTGVAATVLLSPAPTGTSLALTVTGVERGDRCSLVAIGRNGQRDVTSTWVVMYSHGVRVNTGTAMKIHDIQRIEVTTTDGQVLVSLPVKA